MTGRLIPDEALRAKRMDREELRFEDFDEHFSATRLRHYSHIADEAVRILGVIRDGGEGKLDDETLRGVITNACGQAADGAFQAVAGMLDVPMKAVSYAACEWHEQGDNKDDLSMPPSVGFTGFRRRVKAVLRDHLRVVRNNARKRGGERAVAELEAEWFPQNGLPRLPLPD